MIRWPMAAGMIGAALMLAVFGAQAQSGSDTIRKIEEYRQALADGNPADLWEARGEDLWKQKRGPKNVSLEQCDLGKGPGVVHGAYAELPRYFADTDRVMDLESRLVYCMTTQQGFTRAEVLKVTFGDGEKRSDMESLSAYVAGDSRGVKMNIPLAHPKERAAYALGQKIFYYRGGPHDFACATCHGEARRIRLQELPNLTDPKDAQKAYSTWPAYRVSQGEVRTMQWRLNDCFRQQRFPFLEFGSDTSVALLTFLARNANGAAFNAPAIKR